MEVEAIIKFITTNKHLSLAAGCALVLIVGFFIAIWRVFRSDE